MRCRRVRLVKIGTVWCVYVALAMAVTWPVPLSPASTLPVGSGSAATVPLFNTWTIWWNADRLAHGLRSYWDAPIFHPELGTFALSESQPTTWLVAPIVWCGGRVLAYNVYLWLALLLNGLSAFALFRSLRLAWFACFLGGVLAETLPFVQWQLGVLQLVPLCGVFWTLRALRIASRNPTVKHGLLLALSFALTYVTCNHSGVLLSVLLLCGAVWYPGKDVLRPATWTAFVVAGVTAAIVMLPVVVPQLAILGQRQESGEPAYERTKLERLRLSLELADYTVTPAGRGLSVVDLAADSRRPYWTACPGWLKIGVAVSGVLFGLYRRRWRRWTAYSLTFMTAAVLLSLGPGLSIGAWHPFATLIDAWPGFSHIRNVFRFGLFAQIGVVMLATVGFHAAIVTVRLTCPARPRVSRLLRYGTLGFAMLTVLEVPPVGSPVFTVPAASSDDKWISEIRNLPRDRGVACIPFAPGNRLSDFEVSTLWMYYGTFHGRRLVNGYSGYFPPKYFALREVVNESFPSDAACQFLKDFNVDLCVVDRAVHPRATLEQHATGVWQLQRVASDDQIGIDVYRLARRTRSAPIVD
jgi:hypothetical protein